MRLRRLKWILFLVIALPVAAVVAIYATLAGRDFDELRRIAESEVRSATGRELRVAGPIDISLSLTPAIALEDVRFANAPGGSGEDMARARRLELQVALLPLLSGEIQVKRFVLVDAELLLETDAEGRPNWVFADAAEAEDEAAAAARSAERVQEASQGRLPRLEAVEIRNARVTWRDGRSGEVLDVALEQASLREAGDRLEIEAEGRYLDLPFALGGSLGTPDRLLAGGDYPLDLAGHLAETRFELAGSLDGAAENQAADLRISLQGDDLPALSRLAGRELPAVGDYGLAVAIAYAADVLTFDDLRLELAGLTLRGDGSLQDLEGLPRGGFRLDAEGNDLAALGSLAGVDLPDLGAYALAGRFDFDGEALAFESLDGRLLDSRLRGSGRVTGLIEGEPRLSAMLEAEGEAMEDLAAAAGTALPDVGDWRFEGAVEADRRRLSLSDFEARLGESDLAGELDAVLDGERPALRARLRSRTLDLAALLPEGESEGGDAGSREDRGDSPFVIPDTPLPLDLLRGLEADVRVEIVRLRLPDGLQAEDVEIGAALAEGNLLIEPTNLTLYDGSLSGRLRLNAGRQPAVLRSNLRLEGLDLGRMLRDQGVSEALEGRLDARVRLVGRGDSPRAIASTLDGESELDVGEGVISNRLLAIVGAGLSEIMNPLFGGDDTTRLHCVVSRIDFENGIAVNRAALIDASSFSVAGSGRVNLRDESLDLHFDTSSRVPALVSLAVPFNVGGTLKNPRFAPDPLGTAQRAAELAGVAIAPPAALAAMIGIGEARAADENPCTAALEAEAPASSASPQQQIEDLGRGLQEQLQEGLGGSGEDIGRQLRGLFGN